MALHLIGISRSKDVTCLSADEQASDGRKSNHLADSLRWVVQDELAAATVSPRSASYEPLQQGRLLEAIHRHIDVLPVRFGVTLAHAPAVQAFLSSRSNNLLAKLDRLQGTGEFGARLELSPAEATRLSSPPAAGSDPAGSPAEYLARRRNRYAWTDRLEKQARMLTEDCARTLAGLYCGRQTLVSSQPGLLRLAFLVRRPCWPECRVRLANWMDSITCLRRTFLGPWPPYSFL